METSTTHVISALKKDAFAPIVLSYVEAAMRAAWQGTLFEWYSSRPFLMTFSIFKLKTELTTSEMTVKTVRPYVVEGLVSTMLCGGSRQGVWKSTSESLRTRSSMTHCNQVELRRLSCVEGNLIWALVFPLPRGIRPLGAAQGAEPQVRTNLSEPSDSASRARRKMSVFPALRPVENPR